MFGLKDEQLQKIQQTLAQFESIQQAILYGSRAIGNYRPGSDIDLTLKGDNLTLRNIIFPLQDALDELYLPHTFDISIYSQIDHPELLQHIQRVGKIFYQKKLPRLFE